MFFIVKENKRKPQTQPVVIFSSLKVEKMVIFVRSNSSPNEVTFDFCWHFREKSTYHLQLGARMCIWNKLLQIIFSLQFIDWVKLIMDFGGILTFFVIYMKNMCWWFGFFPKQIFLQLIPYIYSLIFIIFINVVAFANCDLQILNSTITILSSFA